MANKNISTVDYTENFNTFFVKDEDDIKQISKDNVKSVLEIGVVTGAIAEADSTLTLTDSIEKPFELHLYGKSTQDGTPTPDNPVEIVSVENPTVTINNGADLSQTKQFNYTLRGIGNVKDELIVNTDGTGQLIQRIGTSSKISGKTISSNSQKVRWIFFGTTIFDGSNITIGNLLCTHCKSTIAGFSGTYGCNEGISRDNTGAIILYLDSMSSIANISDAQKYIDDNHIIIYYSLVTPTITELTAEQIGIILNTYNGTTNILTDQSAGIKAVYTADTKGYIDRKFDELATALVAQTSEQ